MKLSLLLALASLFAVSCAAPEASSDDARRSLGTAEDRAAVERAVLDYVEGIYEAQPERIARSVHPELAKFGFWRESASDPYQGMPMTFEALHDLAGSWNADGSRADESSPKEVVVLDVLDQIAVAKLTAAWGVDYMNLAKVDGRWQIRQVIWQSLSE